MLQRILKLNNLVHQGGFYRRISSVKSLFKETTIGKLEDEDISEDVLSVTRKMEPKKHEHYDSKTISAYLINSNVIFRLKNFLNCTEEEALKMTRENPQIEELKKLRLGKVLDLLFHHGITIKSIVENPFLLTMDENAFKAKIKLVETFISKSVKKGDINDVVALLQVSTLVLTRAATIQERDNDVVPYGSRIYYTAQQLKVEPSYVSKHFSRLMFIFGIPFESIKDILDTLIYYEIEAKHILRDLWVFKYDPQQVKGRLQMCKEAGRENLRPWMVRCKPETLQRSNQIYLDDKNILGEDTVIQYLAKRLNVDEATMNLIVTNKNKQIRKTRAAKIKEVLDYLLDEVKYDRQEIMHAIRIVTHSLDTTKARMIELNRLGCRPKTLHILCRSKVYYKRFVSEWLENRTNHS